VPWCIHKDPTGNHHVNEQPCDEAWDLSHPEDGHVIAESVTLFEKFCETASEEGADVSEHCGNTEHYGDALDGFHDAIVRKQERRTIEMIRGLLSPGVATPSCYSLCSFAAEPWAKPAPASRRIFAKGAWSAGAGSATRSCSALLPRFPFGRVQPRYATPTGWG
jgi:hypothetical protein